MPKQLNVQAFGTPPRVRVERSDSVTDTCWLFVRSELEGDPENPNAFFVPAERFLRSRKSLRSILERFGVGLKVDTKSDRLLRQRLSEEKALEQAMSGTLQKERNLQARLESTRFTRTLYPFQERDLARLLSLPHGANFSVPGAGKTCVTLALYELEREEGKVGNLLIVAPLSAFDSWERESQACLSPAPTVERYAGDISPDTEILLTGYQRLWSNYEKIAEWASADQTHIVLDEAHRMKAGRNGEWGSVCLDLAYTASRRDILTGTPAPNSPLDLESELDFLWPTQGTGLLPDHVRRKDPPPDAGRVIANRIENLFVRTTKSELDLPDTDFDVVTVEADELQRSVYDALKNRYTGRFPIGEETEMTLAQMGEVVMYLLEAATNPLLLVSGSSDDDPDTFRHPPLDPDPDSRLGRLLREYADYSFPPKFRELGKIVRQNSRHGKKTLVWTNFVKNIHVLDDLLDDYDPALLYGDIPSDPDAQRSRSDEIERFRNDDDCKVMIANPAAASEGMSLHRTCHHAVYLERTFNAGQYLQSMNRIHRLGLPEGTVTKFTFLLTRRTIDEVVHRRIEEKSRRMSNMLDDRDIVTMELPSPNDFKEPLDHEADLRALFSHLRGSK